MPSSRNYFQVRAEIQRRFGASREQAEYIYRSLKERYGTAPSIGQVRSVPKASRPAYKAAATRRIKAEEKRLAPEPKPRAVSKPVPVIATDPSGLRYVVDVIGAPKAGAPQRKPAPEASPAPAPVIHRKPPKPAPREFTGEPAPIQERLPRNRFERLCWERKIPYVKGDAAKIAAKAWRQPEQQRALADALKGCYASIARVGYVSDKQRERLRAVLDTFPSGKEWMFYGFLRQFYKKVPPKTGKGSL